MSDANTPEPIRRVLYGAKPTNTDDLASLAPAPGSAISPIFVVTAYRYGMRDAHSYVVGAYPTLVLAVEAARHQVEYRGGKYAAEIVECWPQNATLDEYDVPAQVYYVESPYHGMLGSGNQPADTSTPDKRRKHAAAANRMASRNTGDQP